MNGLLYAAFASYAALLLALWLRHPSALYLQFVTGALLFAWYIVHRRSTVREYRALKARRDAHKRELEDFLAKHP